MSPRTPRSMVVSLFALVAASAVLTLTSAVSVQAQDEAPVVASSAARAAKIEFLKEELRKRVTARKKRAEQARVLEKMHGQMLKGKTPKGVDKMVPWFDEETLSAAAKAQREASPFGVAGSLIAPTNVKANDKTLDSATSGQSEQSIAFLGNYGLCAWNDGQGFVNAPDGQGYATTVDGGVTWVDGGGPPHTAAITSWTSDPVVVVNEKTGEFWYCGLFSGPASTNGVGVVKGTFSGVTFTWGTPSVVAVGANASNGYDKQWMAVDSLTNNLYVTYTLFTATTGHVLGRRSTDGGATWSAATTFSSAAAGSGFLVQGSRPCVGPNGEVYVAWYEVGPVDADFVKVRKSTDNGATFAAEVTAANWFTNFGTGAPGFNRNRGIDMPSIACDRTCGPNRGRVYVAFNETFNWYDDLLGGGGSKSEVESNNSTATATPFTPGQRVRGAFSTTTDVDFFSFAGTAGQNYVFWVDSIPRPLYQFRVYCSDGTTSLALGGDLSAPAGGQGFIVFTPPTTATYFLRMSYTAGGTGTGGYRIQTGLGVANDALHGRDSRDAMVVYSDNGTTWSGNKRMNDSPLGYHEWLPEVAVGNDGTPYGMWFDWRDNAANCGGRSHIYTSRSMDGGNTWLANQVVTTAQTNWGATATNIAPNQGDYNGFSGGAALGYAWSDGRLGDVDVFTGKVNLGLNLTGCPGNSVIIAGQSLSTSVGVDNLNGMWSNNYSYTVTVDRNWPGFPATGSAAAGAAGSTTVPVTITVPDSAAHLEVVHVCVTVNYANGTCGKSCCFDITVSNLATPTLASLASSTADPNKVSLEWLVDSQSDAVVYRSADGNSWSRMGTAARLGEGRVSFVDTDVQGGARYAYRLGLTVGGREIFAGQSWIDVPVAIDFGIRAVRPNPAPMGFAVSFSLRTSEAATLEVLDLSGRRLVSRAVGHLGAGAHTLSLEGETLGLPAGIYAVRLSQGKLSTMTKVTIVR